MLGLRRQLGRGCAVGVEQRTGAGELGPGRDEGRVERHGLLVEADGPPQTRRITRGQALRSGLALQEGVVGRQVRGRLGRELVAGAVAQGYVERARHLGRDVGLDLEDIGERGIESLLPLRGGRGTALDPDEFGADAHPARPTGRFVPPHRGREQVVGAQLAGDLLGCLGRLAVLVRAGPCDDGEPGHVGQLAAHLVGHAIGEVGVPRIAQVLKRENRKALGAHGLRLGCCVTPAPGEEHAQADEEA